ncbi:hypothetical protein HaLaN_13533 [Haematococcus lacustris]|uniref:Uncharacterized protein n=1 Tax=Haematococcus lacustris TaxID=44745 RepID=A0A699ZMG5_HAELA|nr:hypothetical protein HaLaN_13533 [Haematococcus lacustris]
MVSSSSSSFRRAYYKVRQQHSQLQPQQPLWQQLQHG